MYEVELLALLWPGDVRGDERVHESLEVRPPPLRKSVADLPLVVDAFAGELRAYGCEALVEPGLEPLDLVVFGTEIIAGSVMDFEISFLLSKSSQCLWSFTVMQMRTVMKILQCSSSVSGTNSP